MQNEPGQIIYVDLDEEVSSVYNRIKNIRKKVIQLAVPRKALLFQSMVNLKLLKDKMNKKGKELVIVTSDRNGRHLAEKAGLKVISRVEVETHKPMNEESYQVKIKPIQARRNLDFEEERPKRFTEKKMTIRELIEEFRLQKNKYKKEAASILQQFHIGRPSHKFLFLIILASVSLFLIISYIALPSATLYIRPKFDEIDFTVNVILADKRKNQTFLRQNHPHVIASEIVQTTTRQTKVFNTTGKEFKGVNATGKIKILNTTHEEWELKAGTRFQTDEGIIFRISQGVTVPPRTISEEDLPIPGSLTVSVTADALDIYGKPVGERGNLSSAKLTLPALSKYNQRLIWGELDGGTSGGVTRYDTLVTKEDIESAKKQIQDNLFLMAKEDIRTYIDEVNKLNKTNLVLLDDSQSLKTTLDELRISDDLEGSRKEKFEIFAKISAEGVAFDFDQLFKILKKELSTRGKANMRLREESINPENVTYETIEEDSLLGRIKITATVAGIEEYVIDPSSPAGKEFGNRLKEKILGLPLNSAIQLVGNLKEVDAVEIKLWPFGNGKIPSIPENISIRLMETP